MNKGLYLLLGGIAGAVAGSSITYFAVKKKYDEKLNERLADIDGFDKLRKGYEDEDDGDIPFEDEEFPDMEMYESGESSNNKVKTLSEIKKKIKKNEEGIKKIKDRPVTMYNKAYKGSEDGDIDDEEEPDENEGKDYTEIDDEVTLREEIQERKKNANRAPRIISSEAIDELGPTWDHKILEYYTGNDTILDENDDVLLDYERFLGDCLDKYNFKGNDESSIFVQNFELDTVYEILKVMDDYIPE